MTQPNQTYAKRVAAGTCGALAGIGIAAFTIGATDAQLKAVVLVVGIALLIGLCSLMAVMVAWGD